MNLRTVVRGALERMLGSPLAPGEAAPDVAVPDDTGRAVSLREFRGKDVVLFFYPRADTPGCTREACGFQEGLAAFERRGITVLGASRDPIDRQAAFRRGRGLSYRLLADADGALGRAFGVSRGPFHARVTFWIGRDGTIRKVWRDVAVTSHAADVAASIAAACAHEGAAS